MAMFISYTVYAAEKPLTSGFVFIKICF